MELLFLDSLTDKNEQHSYKTIYERYITGRKRILEIGVQRGGSVLTWLATGAEVFGIDKDMPPPYLRHKRFTALHGDAYSPSMLTMLESMSEGKKFDMIVEDGSHKPEDIVWAAKHYTEFLSERGVMVIEDIPNSKVVDDLKQLPGFFTVDFDLRGVKGRFDDRVVVLERVKSAL